MDATLQSKQAQLATARSVLTKTSSKLTVLKSHLDNQIGIPCTLLILTIQKLFLLILSDTDVIFTDIKQYKSVG